MNHTATDAPQDGQPLGLSLHDQLGPLLEKALVDFGVACRFGDTAARQATAEGIRAAAWAALAEERERVEVLRNALLKCKTCALPTEVRFLVTAALRA